MTCRKFAEFVVHILLEGFSAGSDPFNPSEGEEWKGEEANDEMDTKAAVHAERVRQRELSAAWESTFANHPEVDFWEMGDSPEEIHVTYQIHPIWVKGGPLDGTKFPDDKAYRIFQKFGIRYSGETSAGTMQSLSPEERFNQFLGVDVAGYRTKFSDVPQEWEYSKYDIGAGSSDDDYLVFVTLTPESKEDLEGHLRKLSELVTILRNEFEKVGKKAGFTSSRMDRNLGKW